MPWRSLNSAANCCWLAERPSAAEAGGADPGTVTGGETLPTSDCGSFVPAAWAADHEYMVPAANAIHAVNTHRHRFLMGSFLIAKALLFGLFGTLRQFLLFLDDLLQPLDDIDVEVFDLDHAREYVSHLGEDLIGLLLSGVATLRPGGEILDDRLQGYHTLFQRGEHAVHNVVQRLQYLNFNSFLARLIIRLIIIQL